MMFVRRGSQAFELLTLLSVVGEFPNCSIHLLGRERVYKALISKLTEKQTFSHAETGQKLTTKLLTISGKGGAKTVRLYRNVYECGARYPTLPTGTASNRTDTRRCKEAVLLYLAMPQGNLRGGYEQNDVYEDRRRTLHRKRMLCGIQHKGRGDEVVRKGRVQNEASPNRALPIECGHPRGSLCDPFWERRTNRA